jgi:hypothetical protein
MGATATREFAPLSAVGKTGKNMLENIKKASRPENSNYWLIRTKN